jgi:hypothetical protein
MKLTTITMALAFIAGAAGLSGTASAQDHQRPDGQRTHSEQTRHSEVRRDMRHGGGRGWGHHQRCRTVWRHHHRIRQCW